VQSENPTPELEYLPMGQELQIPLKEATPVEYLPAEQFTVHAVAESTA